MHTVLGQVFEVYTGSATLRHRCNENNGLERNVGAGQVSSYHTSLLGNHRPARRVKIVVIPDEADRVSVVPCGLHSLHARTG